MKSTTSPAGSSAVRVDARTLERELRRAAPMAGSTVRFSSGTVQAFLDALDELGYEIVAGRHTPLDDDTVAAIEAAVAGIGGRRPAGSVRFRAGVTVPRLVLALGRLGATIVTGPFD